MIIKTSEFQKVCKNIMSAVDTSTAENEATEILELKVSNNKLCLSVTNGLYYVTNSLIVETDEELHAVVSASLFLQLISKITTESIDIAIKDNVLTIKGNGSYKFPLIFDGESLFVLPKIDFAEVTSSFKISNDILQNIVRYNSKELQKSGIRKPVQKMFYIDNFGAITFASGACVTKFEIETPVKLLLSEKVVKLFKLFNSETVNVDIGYEEVASVIQTRIKLYNDEVTLTAITNNDDSNFNSIPVKIIRGLASSQYANKVIFNKQLVLNALDRLSIFAKKDVVTLYTHLEFSKDTLIIYDTKKENYEIIKLEQSDVEDTFTFILNTNDLKITLDSIKEELVVLRFGNSRAVLFERPYVSNVLPICTIN